MTSQVFGYLRDLRGQLHLPASEEREVIEEIRDHIEDNARELIDEGIPSNDAFYSALNDLGTSTSIAGQLYAVHTQGSWYHTALAVLPHLLLSLMFAFGLWTAPGWLVVLLMVAIIISVLGWRKGRPTWTYPWLGYCLVAPIVSWGLAISAVGYGAWGVLTQGSLPLGIPIYFASFVYIAGSLWIVFRIVSKVTQRDWVMASLTVMPIPFLTYWFLFFYNQKVLVASKGQVSDEVDASAAVVFLILAGGTALFFRIGRRVVRVALLMITVPSLVVLSWLSYQGGPGYMALFTLSAMALAVLLGPALMDQKPKRAHDAVHLLEETG